MASIERKLGLKRSNHVAGGLLTAFLRSGEEARLESPFSSSPRKSAGFSPPVWSVAPAFSSIESMLVGAVLRESGLENLLPLPDDGVLSKGVLAFRCEKDHGEVLSSPLL